MRQKIHIILIALKTFACCPQECDESLTFVGFCTLVQSFLKSCSEGISIIFLHNNVATVTTNINIHKALSDRNALALARVKYDFIVDIVLRVGMRK